MKGGIRHCGENQEYFPYLMVFKFIFLKKCVEAEQNTFADGILQTCVQPLPRGLPGSFLPLCCASSDPCLLVLLIFPQSSHLVFP